MHVEQRHPHGRRDRRTSGRATGLTGEAQSSRHPGRDVEDRTRCACKARRAGRQSVPGARLRDADAVERRDTRHSEEGRGARERPSSRVGPDGQRDAWRDAGNRVPVRVLHSDQDGWCDRGAGARGGGLSAERERRRRTGCHVERTALGAREAAGRGGQRVTRAGLVQREIGERRDARDGGGGDRSPQRARAGIGANGERDTRRRGHVLSLRVANGHPDARRHGRARAD